jgi:endoglucanase
LKEVIKEIRASNPERTLVVGPASWNNVEALPLLELPADDPYLIVTFHYYSPFLFTHQGAEWVPTSEAWLGIEWQGSEQEEKAVRRDLDKALMWAEEHKRPLFLGEFGAYSRADMASRVRWTRYVAREAEERSMSWAYWEFAAGFGVYDRGQRDWNEALLRTLIPVEDKPGSGE